ncbi:gamma-glutamyltransferase [Pseudolysinimonas kribbensis]|uniref:gamma-glutamyltransferase family protein n=1 Tax=Pseudolysinimonas kribbensis TaxID=433641 RepID=UPI0031D4A5B6
MTFTPPSPFTTRPELHGTFGMAATTHWLATASAQAVLERGGTAFDAAIAAGFVLHVVEPHLNGAGGDLVGLYATAGDPTPRVLEGQGPAPAAATIEHYRAEGLGGVPGAGVLAPAVPGAVAAWLALHERHGTWELGDLLAFALGYARDGHPVLGRVAATIGRMREVFVEHWPTSARRWLVEGAPPAPDSIARNPEYARVLEGLAADGLGYWHGEVADAIGAFAGEPTWHPVDGREHRGVLTADDLRAFLPEVAGTAMTYQFRGTTVAKAGPWSQGPVQLLMLAMLDGLPDERLDPSTALGVHTIAEVEALAMADRDAWFGDGCDIRGLFDPGYLAERRALIGERAARDYRPGSPQGRTPWMPPLSTEGELAGRPPGTGEPTVDLRSKGAPRGDTCHLDVIDRWGNIVSVTPSGGWLQSSPTVPEIGFALGTRLQMAWLDPASPTALRPGMRPRTTLSPTLLLRESRAVEALGTPGGDQQDEWQLTYLLRRLVGGWPAQAAIDGPGAHSTAHVGSFEPRTWTPAGLAVEDRLGDDVIADLEARGHVVTREGDWSLGRMSAVGAHPEGGYFAAANPRGSQGYAAGR